MFFSCHVPKQNGASGYIEGHIHYITEDVLGVEGEIFPYGNLFPARDFLRCILLESQNKYLHDNYIIKEGDYIEFWFVIERFSDEDWKTVLSIGTDLILSSEYIGYTED